MRFHSQALLPALSVSRLQMQQDQPAPASFTPLACLPPCLHFRHGLYPLELLTTTLSSLKLLLVTDKKRSKDPCVREVLRKAHNLFAFTKTLFRVI